MSPPVIEMRGVGKTYPGPPPVRALRACDLVVSKGDYLAVTGPSGAGKSTFLNLVGLLDRPSEGAYLVDGVETADLADRDRTRLRGRSVGFVFQAFHLLPHRSAEENAMLGLLYRGIPKGERRRRAGTVLARVGLRHRAHAPASELSGGERQRVAIARALISEPSLLLCDEPTGNLDSASAERVLDLIDQVHASGQTVVVVTHDHGVAARAARAVTISDGELTEVRR